RRCLLAEISQKLADGTGRTKVTAARSTSKILEDKRSATISRRCLLAEISQKLADGTGRTKVTATVRSKQLRIAKKEVKVTALIHPNHSYCSSYLKQKNSNGALFLATYR
ncbi:hypothetical protein, partial [Brochothrix campestris]